MSGPRPAMTTGSPGWWVQADPAVTRGRDRDRIAAGDTDAESYADWMREETPFVADQRAWERALAVVAGTPDLRFDASTEVVLGTPRTPSTAR